MRENTLLVFTSDNGGSTVENNDLKYPDDNCPSGRLTGNNKPLRGQKGDVYEGGTRVPTIVSWPGKIASGKNDTPVQIIDWMPTFCSLAAYDPDRDLKWDGTDLSGLLLKAAKLPNRAIYTAGPRWRASSLRFGDYKLVTRGEGDSSRDGTLQYRGRSRRTAEPRSATTRARARTDCQTPTGRHCRS